MLVQWISSLKKTIGQSLVLGAFIINPSDWEELKLPFASSSQLKISKEEIQLVSDNSIGSYVYKLPKRDAFSYSKGSDLKLTGDWKVKQHPNTRPDFPIAKDQDDYAIRIGAVFEHGEIKVNYPWLVRRRLSRMNLDIGHIVFYATALPEKTPSRRCGVTPFFPENYRVCFSSVGPEWQTFQFKIFTDLNETFERLETVTSRLIGFWLFFDSDDSGSHSDARIRNLKLEWAEK